MNTIPINNNSDRQQNNDEIPTIKEICAKLSKEKKKWLIHVIEHNISDQYYEWQPGRFIGYHITKSGFIIEQSTEFLVEGKMPGHVISFAEKAWGEM